MRVSLIAAVARNGVIGRAGKLPWRLPDDLKHFKRVTLGHPIVMGRKTWESLPGPLPRRPHIVVTRQKSYEASGTEVVHDLDEALALAARHDPDEVFVIGGGELYRAALPRADRLLITHVEADIEGDAFFPEVDWSAWRPVEEHTHPADARHAYPFRIATYERAPTASAMDE